MNVNQTCIVMVGLCIAMILIAAWFRFSERPSIDDVPAASAPVPDSRASDAGPGASREAVDSAQVADSSNEESFHRLQGCAYAARELKVAEVLSDCASYEGKPQFEQLYASCMNGWMNVSSRKAAAEKALKDCGDATDLETRYRVAMMRAARAGDADAQMCYLQSEFGAPGDESPLTKAEVDFYVEAALRRGDWRVVELLTRDSFHAGDAPILLIEEIGEPKTIYQMTKLLRLGATGDFARRLEARLDGMLHPDLVPEAALPGDVVERGDAWARKTFDESFSGSRILAEDPIVCGPGLIFP